MKTTEPRCNSALIGELQERLVTEADPRSRMDLINEVLRPPEPQLLDTCVVQNLDYLYRTFEPDGSAVWDHIATAALIQHYGSELVDDMIALDTMYRRHEYESSYPWLICSAAVHEAGLLSGPKGASLKQLIEFLLGHQDDWSNDAYPGIAQGLLLAQESSRVSPLILKALGVNSVEEVHSTNGPLNFLPDLGDRLVATHALLSNIPVILTTDRRTFWTRRERLAEFGVQVMRPVELLNLYEPYWEALDNEFRRRSGKAQADD